MTAFELTRALERGDLGNESFHHASHLQVGWTYLSESGSIEEACRKMAATLRRFATAAGKPEKYHETITQFWIRLLAILRDSAAVYDLDAILKTNPRLLEKNLTLDYYSAETLWSDSARTTWVEPDLKPFASVEIELECR